MLLTEAIGAKHVAWVAGLERHFTLCTTVGAGDFVHYAWAAIIAGFGTITGHVLIWLATKDKDKGTIELSRTEMVDKRLDLLVTTLQEEMTIMREELRVVKVENRECFADRDQMRGEIRRLNRRLEEVADAQGGC